MQLVQQVTRNAGLIDKIASALELQVAITAKHLSFFIWNVDFNMENVSSLVP